MRLADRAYSALLTASFCGSVCAHAAAHPQGAPPSYYQSVNATSPSTLRATLHAVIDDHMRLPYTSGGVDTWFVLERAQEDPLDPSRILDVYKNQSWDKLTGAYNREHAWPQTYGIPLDTPANVPFTDCHMLHLCDPSYNTARSNKPFRSCTPTCQELTTIGGTQGQYPGLSNWTSGGSSTGTFEVWAGRRGDIARSLLYADVRYEGGVHGTTGLPEPDLVLTDAQALITASNTGQNESLAYMGLRAVLLEWHASDPPDAFERRRNDIVFQYQGNRNPFVDHPEWVDCIFNDTCGFGDIYCSPNATNSTGSPAEISVAGSPLVIDNDLTLIATFLPQNQFGYFLCSLTDSFVIGAGGSQGNLCLGGQIGRFTQGIQSSGIFGTFAYTIDLANLPTSPVQPALPGQTWRFQTWYRDVNPTPTSNLSNALRVTFQ